MPDGSPLGVTGPPEDIDATRATNPDLGEFLIANAPPMTMYLDTANDAVYRKTMVGTWDTLGGSEVHDYFAYDKDKDRLVATKPITTTLNSFYLGDHHKMSSGDNNVFFTNLSTNTAWYPMWGGVKDHNDPANFGMDGVIRPSGRVYQEYNPGVMSFGPPFPFQGVIPPVKLKISFKFTFSTSAYGFSFITETELKDSTLHFKLVDGDGDFVFETYKHGVNAKKGDTITIDFKHPVDTVTDEYATFWVTCTKGCDDDNPLPLYVRPSVARRYPYIKIRLRRFTDEPITFNRDLGQSEWALAEEGSVRSLHLSDLQILLDPDGGILLWDDYYNEAGNSDWSLAQHLNIDTLHLRDLQTITGSNGEYLLWN